MENSNLRRIAAAAVMFMITAAASACGDVSGVGPDLDRLSGVYELSDWVYVIGSDSIRITEDSYVELDFVDDEHVVGEGLVWVIVPRPQPDGTVRNERQPFLFDRSPTNDAIVPVELEGWYYLAEAAGEQPDTLHFRFGKSTGAQTWVEAIGWTLSDDRQMFEYDWSTVGARTNIVLRQR